MEIPGWLNYLFWPRHTIDIKPGQTVVIIGRPGTGKSTLVCWLLREAQSVIVYDSKHDPEEWPRQSDYISIEDVSQLPVHPRVVLRCQSEWLRVRDDWSEKDHPWSIALEYPLQRRDTIALFDEALETFPARNGHPGTHRLVQQGRSFRVTVIVGSQLANNIDTRLLRMANHIFILGPCKHSTELEYIYNANHISTYPLTKLRKHQIAWWTEESHQWVMFRKLKLGFPILFQRRRFKLGMWILPLIVYYLALFFLITMAPILWLLCLALASYPLIRAWLARRWRVNLQCGTWNSQAPLEIPIKQKIERRYRKSFRID